tara:strand:- start:3170 stop:3406 length:237 start_codon:yes stop_codon:yes gene_type:complete
MEDSMSGDYFTHTDRKYDEILARLEKLEEKVRKSQLMMKRTTDGEYERLVDVVVDHDKTITEIVEYSVGTLNEGDTNW